MAFCHAIMMGCLPGMLPAAAAPASLGMTKTKSAGPQVKSVNFRNAGLYIYGQFGSKMAVDCTGPAFPGAIKWSAPNPKNHRPRTRCASPPARKSGSHQSPLSEIGVEGQRGSERGFKSRIVVVRRLRGCGGDWKLKLLACAPKFPPKTTIAVAPLPNDGPTRNHQPK